MIDLKVNLKRFSQKEIEDRIPEVQELIENQIPFYADPTFITPYMLVYGTLRTYGGNWNRLFKDTTEHLDTFKMRGYKKSNSIVTMFTGNLEEDWTVMDLFKINDSHINSVNKYVDWLESGYQAVAVPIKLEEKTILAKFWEVKWNDVKRKVEHDYLTQDGGIFSYTKISDNQWKKDFPKSYKFYHE
jgi:gamma-glutamylcyclotransferase (GGCT)/AIG2-like uncharacterized protein YtfP